MSNEPVLSPRQVEEQRTRVIDALTEHFAQDNLTMEELEQRLDQVYASSTSSALTAVLAGLPSLSAQAPVATSGTGTAPAVRPQEGYTTRTLVALMSGVMRRGTWTVPRYLQTISFMGGIELDLRTAQLTHQVTEITVFAVMGGVVITIPPGYRIESEGFAIMGGFDDGHATLASTDPSAPLIRLKGLAIMGGVEVRVLDAAIRVE